jgi:hypothetical protein
MVVEIYTPSVERLKVSLKTQGREADLSKTRQNLVRKCSHFLWVIRQATDTDTARPRQYSIVEKRQAYLELSYLCRTFVSLWKWQGKPTKARQGKCLRRHNHSPKFLVRCCQGRIEMMRTRQGKSKARTCHSTTADGSRFYLELSYLCRTFVSLN